MDTLSFADTSENRAAAFWRDETGAVSIWMLFWTLAFLTLGGIAVDTSQAWRVKTMLQAAADAAAYGGAVALAHRTTAAEAGVESEHPVEVVLGLVEDVLTPNGPRPPIHVVEGDDPVEVALAMARRNLPQEAMGTVLTREDVELGIWDPVNREFIRSSVAPNAIRVTTRRSHKNGNPEPTYLARLAGFNHWDIGVQSVARTFRSPRAECVDPVLTARTRVDLQSNDVWVGICVRAKANAVVDTSETWLSNAVVALVDRIVLETLAPHAEAQQQVASLSLDATLDSGTGSRPVSLIDQYLGRAAAHGNLRTMVANLKATATATLHRNDLDFTQLIGDATYHVECNDNQTLYIPGGVPISNVVILSDCPVRVDQNARLETTVIISNLDALKHIELTVQQPSGLSFGAEDNCGPGDGVRVMIFVDFETTARFKIFDPEVFPLGDLVAAAQTEGGGPESDVDLGINIDVEDEVLTGAVLEDLLGICVGAEYLLEVNAFALAE